MVEFKMPSLGADMEAGTLVEWLVKPGSSVKRGDIIAVVDTQKGLIDIEVFDEGIISELVIRENQKVPVGTVMALIESAKKEVGKKEIQVSQEIIEGEKIEKIIIPEIPHGIKASPLAKRIAVQKGIDLTKVKGTGEAGVITKEDVERIIEEKTIPVEEKKITVAENIRVAVAAAMSKSNREIPHYYL